MNIFSFTAEFDSEESCRTHFKEERDKLGVTCKRCSHKVHYWINCVWLLDADPTEIRKDKIILDKINKVKAWRESSNRPNTKKMASTPTIFAEIRQPNSDYLAFPTVSSEIRNYIPIVYLNPKIIASNQLYTIPNVTKYDFGILTSSMHMTWMRYVAGRLKSDYRYSSSVVYNNYPWTNNVTSKNKKSVEDKALKILNIRAEFPKSSLSNLYHPLTMPPKLAKAHQSLDKAVDLCYRPQVFPNKNSRIEYLFELYNQYAEPLLNENKTKKKKENTGHNIELR